YNACKSYSYNYLMGDKLKMAQEEAQEIFSEAIVAIFFAILNDKFEKKSSFRTFYTSILNNKLKDFLGRKHKLQNINWEDKTTLDSRTSEREEELSDKEGFQLVVRIFTSLAAQTLPQDFFDLPYEKQINSSFFEEIECLNYYRMRTEGFSWEVIAERKNETIEAVKKKEGRCLEKIKKVLSKKFPREHQILLRTFTRKKFRNG
ncbi:MAG: sigma-70 family RNA polymerase sigma factor, partial [Bacteroidetes bacterium]|nr:sigma-70 family RNA polymerase sigma factor [Bacteroidota bacterium]